MDKYPLIIFENKNIVSDDIDNKYDLITISEVMWYLLDSMDMVFDKLFNSLNNDGILAIHQYFPDNQNFGNDIIDGLEDFEKFIEQRTRFKFVNKIVSYEKKRQSSFGAIKKKRVINARI